MENRLAERALELAGFEPGTEAFSRLAAASKMPGLSPDLIVKGVHPYDLRNIRKLFDIPPLTEAELKRFREQLGDFVATDFIEGFLPDFERLQSLGATTLAELGVKE